MNFCLMKWLSFSTDQISVEPPQSNILKRKEVLQRNDEKDIRQVASTLPGRNKKTKEDARQDECRVAGATGAWNVHVFFVWFWQARKYLLSSSEWQASVRNVAQRHLVYRGISVLH